MQTTIALLALALAHTDATFPDWMQGRWCSAQGAERGEEHWLAPAGELMLGMSRSVAPGRRTEFEFLRIELVDGVPAYIAQPQGAPPTTFKRVDGGSDWIGFENRAHDFPQRIEYRRPGRYALRAEISGPGKNGAEKRIAFDFTACGHHGRSD